MMTRAQILQQAALHQPSNRLEPLLTKNTGTVVDQIREARQVGINANHAAVVVGNAVGVNVGGSTVAGLPPLTITRTAVVQRGQVGFGATTYHPRGQFYDMKVAFALGFQTRGVGGTSSIPKPKLTASDKAHAGQNYGNPLVNPGRSTQYNVKLEIFQNRAEPMLTGFATLWTCPTGWTWTDGASDQVNVAVTSNPCVIIRTIQTPSTIIKKGAFIVKVTQAYPSAAPTPVVL